MIGLLAAITELEENDRAFVLHLYKNYYCLARKIIFSITHDNKDIEDLINDAFIKLIEKISLIRTFDSCKTTTYVVYTVRSISINYIKHKKVEKKHIFYSDDIDIAVDLSNLENDSGYELVRQEELDLLSDAVSKLPQKKKDLLYFKYVLEMKDEEIAKIFEIAPNSIRQYLTRARRDARKLIQREESYNAK
ncbi:RNA polymerase sigma factor [Ruminiclostridium cellobioparum]|jgi:RNA polymerase sigma-70 factor, ECF subfamily|uniref:RNA polymerase sigma factor, sigma-70 family n=1 Tax=Ruminiclostridium cellobioparum subsp. termitidis CT1112 TaxID=1195236 RepID=S0FU28_RUMCE|nr:sigma-70 family RNA polymerase sigma factor [Ruminiclostridium cellobioparum]EMS72689.1 RNA polymerase sigma factor, sigma-70 family [Ruminiclostridium cellobioparum subsp. termitidis CT1112]